MIISLTADSGRQANGVLARVFFREDGCFERHDGIFQKNLLANALLLQYASHCKYGVHENA
jgi:hypothetical protein